MMPTPRQLKQYHVFLASPGDVGEERQSVRKFFDEYNHNTARLWNVRFEVVDWENHATVGIGRPQELITQQTLEKYRESLALVIGIMAQRFGSPSGKAESGTEEEFNWAMEANRASGFPEIKWFFRKVEQLDGLPTDPAEAIKALEQWKKVHNFRTQMQNLANPIFYAEYPNALSFQEVFERDLRLWLSDSMRPWVMEAGLQESKTERVAPTVQHAKFNAECYSKALIKRFDKLNFDMIDTDGAYYHSIRLWSVFTPQSVRECHQYHPRLLEIPKEYQQRMLDAGEINAKELEDAEKQADKLRQEYYSQPLRSVLDVVKDALQTVHAGIARKLVILGDPGSGKSSLIRYLALSWVDLTEPDIHGTSPIPIVIELGSYGRWQCAGRKDLVRYLEEAPGWSDWPKGVLDGLVKQSGRVVMLLDGLDEVFDVQMRANVIEDIQRFSSQYSQTPIIITSRVVGYQRRQLPDEFQHFMLQDLDLDQITNFVNRWHEVAFENDALAAPKRDRLIKAIHQSKSIAMLAGNPLLLTMMAILNRNQDLPRDRVDLYAQASRVLLHQWDTERALSDYPGINTEIGLREKTDILRRIALHMQAADGGLKGNLIDGNTLTYLIEDYLQSELNFYQARAAARAVVDQLRQRNFILCFVGADSYAFVHRTFLEYYCAADFVHQFNITKKLQINDLIALFDQHCRDDEWREVLRLICGQIDQQFVQVIVETLSAHVDLDNWDGYLPLLELPLAVWCLGEARNKGKLGGVTESLLDLCVRAICNAEITDLRSESDQWLFEIGYAVEQSGIRVKLKPEWEDMVFEAIETLKHTIYVWPHFIRAATGNREYIVDLAINCPESSTRWQAIEALSDGWPDETTRSLITQVALQDDDDLPRRIALYALTDKWPDSATRDLLFQKVTQDEDASTRSSALRLLADKWQDPPIRELVVERAVHDEGYVARSNALELLVEKWPDSTTRDILIQRLSRDLHYSPRNSALRGLAETWSDQSTRELVIRHAVQDRYYSTRSAALQILADVWPDQASQDLIVNRVVQDRHNLPRCTAMQILARLWPEQSTKELLVRRSVKAKIITERAVASYLLGKMHSKFALIVFTRDLDGVRPYLDPLEPISFEHIKNAALNTDIPVGDIENQIASLSNYLGWDITIGAKKLV